MNDWEKTFDIIDSHLKKLKAKIKLVEECEQEKTIIRVPDNIHIENNCGPGDTLGIRFNNDRQVLYTRNGLYIVGERGQDGKDFHDSIIPCKLTPIDPTDRKVDHLYFMADMKVEHVDFNVDEYNWCKYLGDGRYVYVEGEIDIVVETVKWSYWYAVTPLEEGD